MLQEVVNYLAKNYHEEPLIAVPCISCPARTRGRMGQDNTPTCFNCANTVAMVAVRASSAAAQPASAETALTASILGRFRAAVHMLVSTLNGTVDTIDSNSAILSHGSTTGELTAVHESLPVAI